MTQSNTTTHSEYADNRAWSGRGNLKQLVAELDRQKASTYDFVTDTRNLNVEVVERGGQNVAMLRNCGTDRYLTEFVPTEGLPVSHHAIGQLGGRMAPAVPTKFLRQLVAERPAIAGTLLTDLLRETQSTNLVRTLDGRVRAFLSDRYQPLDHHQLAFAALEVAREHGAEVIEASLSETHMRIKFVTRSVWGAVDAVKQGNRGDWYAGGLGNQEYLSKVAANSRGDLPGGPGTVHPVVTIGNSETGHGSLFVRIGFLQAICFNLATVEDVAHRAHVGSRLDAGIYSQETMRLEAAATMSKASDAIKTAFNAERFDALVRRINAANEVEVEPTKAVDFAVAQGVVTQEKRDDLLAHFLGDSAAGLVGNTAYGFAQGLARFAQECESGDTASDIEALAGQVIMKPSLVAC